jgi:preprotein translocase subunit YajC
MRRAHRTVHRALWPVLAVLVMLGFAAALLLRPERKEETSDQKPVISRVASGDWLLIAGH